MWHTFVASVKIDIFKVERMDVAGQVPQNSKADVDKKVQAATTDHEDANRRDCNALSGVEQGDWVDLGSNLRRMVMRTMRMAGRASDILMVAALSELDANTS